MGAKALYLRGCACLLRDITEHHEADKNPLPRPPRGTDRFTEPGTVGDRLHHALGEALRRRSEVALMFLDLDRFKSINDTLGHAVGDSLLKAVARRLLACIRVCDTLARLGGDEFTIILTHLERESKPPMLRKRCTSSFNTRF